MSGASGAGPGENRAAEESPVNWGHSYLSRLALLWEVERFVEVCPKMLKTDEHTIMSNRAKTVKMYIALEVLRWRISCCFPLPSAASVD